MNEKILVLGATGLVGNALLRAWWAAGAAVTGTSRQASPGFLSLDMRDESAVRELLAHAQPSVVAVPAANPHVDDCELHPAESRAVNVVGTLHVVRACRALGARMIFYSSDYVFDGVKGVYKEEDAPSPINEYGRQKVETEGGVLSGDAHNLVLRVSGVYGWEPKPKNFALQIIGRLSAGQATDVVNDVRYNPTYADNLAAITVELVRRRARGIFHVVGADQLSRFEFASRIARAFDLDERLLKPVATVAAPGRAPRPQQSSLDTAKVRAAVAVRPVGVEEGLRTMRAQEGVWRAYAQTLLA